MFRSVDLPLFWHNLNLQNILRVSCFQNMWLSSLVMGGCTPNYSFIFRAVPPPIRRYADAPIRQYADRCSAPCCGVSEYSVPPNLNKAAGRSIGVSEYLRFVSQSISRFGVSEYWSIGVVIDLKLEANNSSEYRSIGVSAYIRFSRLYLPPLCKGRSERPLP